MDVSKVMTTMVHTVSPDAPLSYVARKMRDLNIGAMPVLDGRTLVGIVTDRDIVVRALARDRFSLTTTVSEIMTPDPVCCALTDSMDHVVEMMEERQVRRLPVVDKNGKLAGIVAMGDIATHVSHELAGEAIEIVSLPPRPRAEAPAPMH